MITMRASLSLLLLQLLYIVDVFAGPDLRSFWAAEGLALSEVAWNSVVDRYVEKQDFSNQYMYYINIIQVGIVLTCKYVSRLYYKLTSSAPTLGSTLLCSSWSRSCSGIHTIHPFAFTESQESKSDMNIARQCALRYI